MTPRVNELFIRKIYRSFQCIHLIYSDILRPSMEHFNNKDSIQLWILQSFANFFSSYLLKKKWNSFIIKRKLDYVKFPTVMSFLNPIFSIECGSKLFSSFSTLWSLSRMDYFSVLGEDENWGYLRKFLLSSSYPVTLNNYFYELKLAAEVLLLNNFYYFQSINFEIYSNLYHKVLRTYQLWLRKYSKSIMLKLIYVNVCIYLAANYKLVGIKSKLRFSSTASNAIDVKG